MSISRYWKKNSNQLEYIKRQTDVKSHHTLDRAHRAFCKIMLCAIQINIIITNIHWMDSLNIKLPIKEDKLYVVPIECHGNALIN